MAGGHVRRYHSDPDRTSATVRLVVQAPAPIFYRAPVIAPQDHIHIAVTPESGQTIERKAMVYNPPYAAKMLALVVAAIATGALCIYEISEHGDLVKALAEEEDYEAPPVGFTS